MSASEKYTSMGEGAPDMRPDASQINPMQAVYNPNLPDMALAESMALENIRLCGAWVTVIPRTDDEKRDQIWDSDPDPTYYSGFDFKAFFKPEPAEIMLGKFGHDAPNKFDLIFSRAEVLNIMKERLIRIGDIIIVPHNSLIIKARRYRALHVTEQGNYRYRWLYLNVTVENINKDTAFEPKFM
jgi:hypothetical protein